MRQQLTSTSTHDVIVCGAGPAGVAAALAGARAGARTLLIERYGFAGGVATAALVNPIAGHEFRVAGSHGVRSLILGLFGEIFTKLHAEGGYGSALTQPAFDEERLKLIYDRLLQESGVEVLYHRTLTAVERDGARIVAVCSQGKDGVIRHQGQVFIDGTGDGDLAALAGCDCSIGRAADGLCQAMTMNFRVGGVDKDGMLAELADRGSVRHHKPARLLVDAYFQCARAEGRLVYPHREWIHFYDYPRPGVLHFNMTRVHQLSGLSAADLTRAEIECRRQAGQLTDWLVGEVPWFRNAWLEKLAVQVGVRETRHIHGIYTMTAEDITSARKFEDGIARSAYFIDIHSPTGAGFDHEVRGGKGAVAEAYRVPDGDWYEVPYRCLLPRDVANLLVPCRALSATHEAAAAVRVMATLHATGEAAGLAAAMAVAGGTTPQRLDGCDLRRRISYMDQPPAAGLPWDNNPL
jgi:hypothetical protein